MPPMPLGSSIPPRRIDEADSKDEDDVEQQQGSGGQGQEGIDPSPSYDSADPNGRVLGNLSSDGEDSAVAGLSALGGGGDAAASGDAASASASASDSDAESKDLEEATDEAAKRMLAALASPFAPMGEGEAKAEAEDEEMFSEPRSDYEAEEIKLSQRSEKGDDKDKGGGLLGAIGASFKSLTKKPDEYQKLPDDKDGDDAAAVAAAVAGAGAAAAAKKSTGVRATSVSLGTGNIEQADEIPARTAFEPPEDMTPKKDDGSSARAAIGVAAAAGAGAAAGAAVASAPTAAAPAPVDGKNGYVSGFATGGVIEEGPTIPARAVYDEPIDMTPEDVKNGDGAGSKAAIAAAAAAGAAAGGAAAAAAAKSKPRAGSIRADAPVTTPIEVGEIEDVRARADFPQPCKLEDYTPEGEDEGTAYDEPISIGTYEAPAAVAATATVATVSNPVRGAPEDQVKSIPPPMPLSEEGMAERRKKYCQAFKILAFIAVLVAVIVGLSVGISNSQNQGDSPAPTPPSDTPAPSATATAPTPAPVPGQTPAPTVTAPTPAPVPGQTPAPTAAAPVAGPTQDPFVQLQEYLISVSPDGGAALQDPTTPQYAALTWLSENPLLDTYPETCINQRYSLATLYYSTDGENWELPENSGWLGLETPECEWFGIVCEAAPNQRQLLRRRTSTFTEDFTRIVKKVQLFELNLAGPLPAEIVLLPDLEDMNLYGNALTGTIPTVIGEISFLEVLELDGNSMTGPIPTELYGLANLNALRLENNQLTGTIATEVGEMKNVEKFRLDRNNIVGTIPQEMGDMTGLQELRLNGNSDLGGPVPDNLGGLIAAEAIYLHETSLTGTMPPQVCSLIARNLQDLTSDCGGTDPEIECECCTQCYPLEA